MADLVMRVTAFVKSDDMMDVEGCDLRMRVQAWVKEWYGDRCEQHEADCPICRAWQAFDQLFADVTE